MMVTSSYSVQVWNSFASMGITPQQLPPNTYKSFKRWWTSMIGPANNQAARETEQTVIYIAWNIWKERCRRVFDNKAMMAPQMVALIQLDIVN
ncbi:hypothetical protein HU200_018467 [Digitaria exilis]|uniref:Uncharacterized protein n=1 Tax=Digitaria exilis TaxID=1010633 RepID=A0A835F463_9POAL|nr:hypothetical protein HU200_018467 [Digitaria exilis]